MSNPHSAAAGLISTATGEEANNFLLDGLDNNQVSENAVGYTPSVDAFEEFNMITQNASAEFGHFMGLCR